MNFYSKIVIFIIVAFVFGCKSNKVTIKYDDESRYEDIDKKMIADKSKESVTIFFENFFNGQVKGFIGNELMFDKNIETEESLGTTNEYFFYDYSRNQKLPKIRIENEDEIAEIEINNDYKLIYVYKHNDNWEIIYSNVYPTYE
jgi:hypothetical protein